MVCFHVFYGKVVCPSMCVYRSACSHRLVREWRQDNGLLHGVHHQLPQLLQHTLQHSLLTDLSKQGQAGGRWENKNGWLLQIPMRPKKDFTYFSLLIYWQITQRLLSLFLCLWVVGMFSIDINDPKIIMELSQNPSQKWGNSIWILNFRVWIELFSAAT